MNHKIKILFLEDQPADSERIIRELKNGEVNCETAVVISRADFVKALHDFSPDLILCTDSIPSFGTCQVLRLMKDEDIGIPLITVTETLTAEFAVQVMKEGADDCILKACLQHLPLAVDTSIKKYRLKEEEKKKVEFLIHSEQKFHHTLNNMIEGAQMHDFSWRYIYVNDALVEYSTYTREELMGYTLMEKYPGIEQTELFGILNRCMTDRTGERFETEFVFPDGTKADFELNIEPIPEGLFILSVDHTEKKRATEKIQKANRLYAFLSAVNQAIVHTQDEQTLLNNTCDIARDIGQFVMGWIDLVDEESGKLIMVSQSGTSAATIEAKKHSGMDVTNPLLQDTPTAKVLRTGKYATSNDAQNDPAFEPWKTQLISNGIKSSISLPLTRFGKVIGVLGVHSAKAGFFDTEEIALLEEAASDVSYALEIIQKNKVHKETEELVIYNESRFRALIESSADMTCLSVPEGDILYASPSIFKHFGYTPAEFMSKQVAYYIHPDDHLPDAAIDALFNIPGNSITVQQRMLHKDGSWVWTEGTITNMLHEHGVQALVANIRNISERKEAEKQLLKSEIFNRAVLNSLSSHIAVVGGDGAVIAVNEAWTRYALENGETILERTCVGSNYFSVCKKSIAAGVEEASKVLEGMKAVLNKARDDFYLEYACSSPDIRRWFGMRVLKFEGDEPMIVVAHNEITERKLAEENLLESEERLVEAQAIGHIANWEIDMITNRQVWSDEFYKIFGVEKGSVIPSTEAFLSFIHPDDLAFAVSKIENSFKELTGTLIDFRFFSKEGQVRFAHAEARFEFDQNHNPLRLYGIVQDITEQKNAEETLLQTKQLLAEAQNLAKIGNWNFDVVKNEVFWSDSLRRINGFSPDHKPGMETNLAIVHIDDRERVAGEIMELRRSGETMETTYRIVRPDTGEMRTICALSSVEFDQQGNLLRMYGIAEDITELHYAQQERDKLMLELEQRVETRTKELVDKNKNILDSINYAKRIQLGLLMRDSQLLEIFPKAFILSLPRDIVSGDFFWCYQRRNKKFIVLADCTGHGVPGALMSIIGNNLLGQIIMDEHIENPTEILEVLDLRLAEAVKGDTQEVRDGMDISLCVVDSSFNELYFAGAYQPVFVTDKKGQITMLAASRHAIGAGVEGVNKGFETTRIPIFPGQRIYFSSDGFYSQFGGVKNKKLMKSGFRNALEQQQEQPMAEQKKQLVQLLNEWMNGYEQVDDILIIGIEL